MRLSLLALATCLLAPAAAAQSTPVSDAFRKGEERASRHLVAAAEEMPADKYGYKPTPAQMSFADVIVHLAEGNDFLCGQISGAAAPKRAEVKPGAGKDKQVARLKETFDFCASVRPPRLHPGGGDVHHGGRLGRPLQPARQLPPAQWTGAADGEGEGGVAGYAPRLPGAAPLERVRELGGAGESVRRQLLQRDEDGPGASLFTVHFSPCHH
jgi:hypothetical protein